MNLERKINWMDLGETSIEEARALQSDLLKKRQNKEIPDTILFTQHPLSINFGMSNEQNKLADSTEAEIKHNYGSLTKDTITQYFAEKGIPFTQSNHGGGASVFAPGQYICYPIVNIEDITKKKMTKEDISAVGIYVNRILETMKDTLENMGVGNVQIRETNLNPSEKKNRKDVWIDFPDKSYKIGSKAIRVEKGVAYHGFSLFVEQAGVEPFHYVKPCGYDNAEIGITSVEEQIGQKLKKEDVYSTLKKSILKNIYQ